MAADKRVRGCERESVEHADKEQELAHPLRFVWHRQIATDDPTASYTQQAVCLAINLDQSGNLDDTMCLYLRSWLAQKAHPMRKMKPIINHS